MKRPAILTIYTETKWIASVVNSNSILEVTKKLNNRDIWVQINSELAKHNYKFVYCIENDNKIYKALLSRSRQKAYRALDSERITI